MGQSSFCSLTFLFLFSITTSFAQNTSFHPKEVWEDPLQADSLRFKAIYSFYEKNTLAQPDSVLPVTDFHFDLANRRGNNLEMISALSEKSYAYFVKDNAKKAEETLRQAIKIQATLNDSIALARLYTNLASIYRAQSNFVETIKYYNYSLKIFEVKHERKIEAAVLGNLGLVYYDLKNYEIAAYYFDKSLALYKEINLQNKVGYISLYIGAIDYEKGDYAKSIYLAEKALKIFEKENNFLSKSDCHELIAKSFQKLNNRDKTISEINKSLEINIQLKNITKIIQNKMFLAQHYLDYDVPRATQIGEEVLRVIDSTSDKKAKSSLYYLLYQCYKKKNEIERSHRMYENYIVYNDSVVKEQSNLELIKEAVNQEYNIKILKNKLSYEQIERDLKLAQSVKVGLIVLIFLIVLISTLVYFNKRNNYDKQKRTELIEEIDKLKQSYTALNSVAKENFVLNRRKIENSINRKLNDTDWGVLNVLAQNPVISNKELASKVFLSVDGIGSSLRRMYDYFEIEDSKYKKTDLIRKVIQVSNKSV
jgi:tetratricopeptide (TPR) repeat protein